ncbi:MAG TPA: hypothetical protein VGM60_23535 [Pseudonocardia sp.]|jgi:hypothetical protein|uniref:hypothetical protein n=1 Tax=Pseudonocardia sp. TaxID=60912 RepID=UPI002F3F8190
MKGKLGQRAVIATAAVAFSTMAFSGTAFANGHHKIDGDGGNGGNGGNTNANCLVPIGASAGVLGQGAPVGQCNAKSGKGGDAGDGVHH